jgi:hypothetical protein
MTQRRLSDEGYARAQFRGPVDFLLPDGEHLVAPCVARFTRERWQGVLNLRGLERLPEQGDVCRLSAERLGDLRIIILDKVGTFRYEFIALVKPDPFESL